jgi:hypothetical protein
MSQRYRPFMVGASEEIGSQEVEDPWLLGRRPLTGSSLRLPLPMGGSHPVPAQLIDSHCRFARHAAATAAATGDPAIVVSVRRASRRERSHGREARFASGGRQRLLELSRTPECAILVRSCLMLRWLPYWRRGAGAGWQAPPPVVRRGMFCCRRPSACLGPLCDPTIVKCGRDFSAA